MPTSTNSPPNDSPEGWRRLPPVGYEDLDESRVNAELIKTMREACQKREFPIYLFGGPGVGKSYAAALVFCRWHGSRVTMVRYSELLTDCARADFEGCVDSIASNGTPFQMTTKGWWRWLEEVDLLIIDEVGTGISSDPRLEWFRRVLECRKGKPLLMTGNLTVDEVKSQLTNRISSRVCSGRMIRVDGCDLRTDGATQRMTVIKANQKDKK